MGGFDGKGYSNSVYESTNLVTCKQIKNAPWTPRQMHQGVVLNGKIYIMGGWAGPLYDIWSFDGITWQRIRNHAEWSPRSDFCAVVTDGLMFI